MFGKICVGLGVVGLVAFARADCHAGVERRTSEPQRLFPVVRRQPVREVMHLDLVFAVGAGAGHQHDAMPTRRHSRRQPAGTKPADVRHLRVAMVDKDGLHAGVPLNTA